ncbi:pro-melanin-concentrating hormone, like [Sardina pilchardus]|uniref:pro-melanin-concentrating hormone, like n=1 Tax=Sardina pilchardus TaxID=27697 RepID=UPI002E0ED267
MKISIVSALLSIALLFECHTLTSSASPAGRAGDSSAEQDVLAQLLDEEAGEASRDAGGPRVIVVGDASLWGTLRTLERATLPHLATAVRRDTNQEPISNSLSVLRRDTMRCMVGRVYRPCWEV